MGSSQFFLFSIPGDVNVNLLATRLTNFVLVKYNDDDITIEMYGENPDVNLEGLVERLKQKRYRAELIKRRFIPKEKGKQRFGYFDTRR